MFSCLFSTTHWLCDSVSNLLLLLQGNYKLQHIFFESCISSILTDLKHPAAVHIHTLPAFIYRLQHGDQQDALKKKKPGEPLRLHLWTARPLVV